MFDYTPPSFSPYLFHPNECYASDSNFEATLTLLEVFANHPEDEEIKSLTEDILIIETKEGVFIRAQDREWCELLTTYSNNPHDELPKLKIIPQSDWDSMTIKQRGPINSHGDEKLARWRVGF